MQQYLQACTAAPVLNLQRVSTQVVAVFKALFTAAPLGLSVQLLACMFDSRVDSGALINSNVRVFMTHMVTCAALTLQLGVVIAMCWRLEDFCHNTSA